MQGAIVGDLSEVVLECSSPHVITRALKSSRVKGRSEKPETTTFTADLSVQPLSQKELLRLPEGMRNRGAVKVYGVVELKTVQTSECKVPDRFEHQGINYQIDMVESWDELGGFWKFTATRVER